MSVFNNSSLSSDGLIFAIDLANKKSWTGKPVTNLFPCPTPAADMSVAFPANGTGTFYRVLNGNYGDYDIKPTDVVYRYDFTLDGCHFHGMGGIPIVNGAQYTFSGEYYISPICIGYPQINYLANMEGGLGGAAFETNSSLTGVWKSFAITGTAVSTTGNALLYPGACSSGRLAASGFILYKNPILSQNGYAVPFTQTSRSVTEALKDLTNNVTCDVTAAAYDSSGNITFNSSGKIRTNTNFSNIMNEWTIECWCKPGTTQVTYADIWGNHAGGGGITGFVLQQNAGNTNQYYCAYGNGSNWQQSSVFTLTASVWQHVVVTKDASNIHKVYINGILIITDNLSGNHVPSTQNFLIGDGIAGEGRPWNGSIDVVRVYNRALPAGEIYSNFRAMAGRFGLA